MAAHAIIDNSLPSCDVIDQCVGLIDKWRWTGGQESTERLHSHPWVLAFGVVLRGRLLEVVGTEESPPRRRGFLSLGMYTRGTLHRIHDGDALTVFVGLLRTQKRIERAAEVRTAEGYCHYTEIMPDEPGFRPDFVAAGSK